MNGKMMLLSVGTKITWILCGVFAMAAIFTIGVLYSRSRLSRIKRYTAADEHEEARALLRKLEKRTFGKRRLELRYYLAYDFLVAGEYDAFFSEIEKMRTYKGKVTEIYRTDCVYLLLIARLFLRDGAGAAKAFCAFRSAMEANKFFVSKFGVFEPFFAAVLAWIDGAHDEETVRTIRSFSADGEGSVLVRRLASELTAEAS